MKMVDTDASLAKGTMYLVLAQAIFIFFGFIVHFWLGRSLGPDIYGTYGIVLALLTGFHLILSSGIPQVVTKLIAEHPQSSLQIRNHALRIQMVLSIAIAIPYFILSPVLATLLGDPDLTVYFRISAFAIPSYSSYAIAVGYLNGLREFKRQSIMISVYGGIKLLATLILTLMSGLIGAIIALAIGPITSFIFYGRHIRKTEVVEKIKKLNMRPLIKMSIPFTGFTIAITLLMNIDLLLVKKVLGDPYETGLYAAASIISKVPYFLITGLSLVIFPAVAAAFSAKKDDELKRIVSETVRASLFFLIPLTILLSSTSHFVLSLVYGAEYVGGAAAMAVLSIGLGLIAMFLVLGYILNAIGKAWLSFLLATFGLAVGIVADLLLIERFELVGAATGILIAAFLVTIIAAVIVRSYIGALIPVKNLLRFSLAGLAIYFVSFLNLSETLVVIKYGLGALIFLAVLIVTGELGKDDLELLNVLRQNKSTDIKRIGTEV